MKSARFLGLFATVFCALFLASCSQSTDTSSQPKYLVYDENPVIMKLIFEPKFTLCFTSKSLKGQKYRDWAKTSFAEWLDAIRPISPKPLATTIEIVEESPQRKCIRDNDTPDPRNPMMTVEVTGGGPGGAGGGLVVEVALSGDDQDDWHIMIHEMGHSFGLADLYDDTTCPGHTNSNGNTVPDQIHDADDPYANKCTDGAVMNGAERPLAIHLQPDDIAGVRYLFKKVLRNI